MMKKNEWYNKLDKLHYFLMGVVLTLVVPYLMGSTYPIKPSAPLTLSGNSDVVQFTVKGSANQSTAQLIELYDSAGALSGAITADGNFQGSDGPGSNVVYALVGELDTGIASAGTGFVGINIDGTEHIRVGNGVKIR